jgi:hypothetical protein
MKETWIAFFIMSRRNMEQGEVVGGHVWEDKDSNGGMHWLLGFSNT